MVLWTYRCYDDGSAPSLWQSWYAAHPEAQGSHDTIFRILEQQPQWNKGPYTDNLPGKVIEVRLSGLVQWRVLGHYGEARREFVVTAIGFHQGKNNYTPKGLLGLAAARRIEVLEGKVDAPVCNRPR